MKDIGEQRGQSKHDSQNVQPHRRAYRLAVLAIVEAQLQHHCDQADRSDDYHRQRAAECAGLGVDHHQR